MRAEEIEGLIEAYSKVHETPEVLNEGTEQLDELSYAARRELAGLRGLAGRAAVPLAGVATWADTSDQERAAAQHLKRTGVRPGELYRPSDVDAQGRPKPGAKPQLDRLTSGAKPTRQVQNQIDKNERDRRTMNPGDYFGTNPEKPKPSPGPTGSPGPGSNRPGPSGTPGGTPSNVISAKNIAGQSQKVTVGRKYGATLGGQKGNVTYDASGKRTFVADKPSTAAEKPTTSPASDKPTTPSTPTAKPSAMDQWRAANPKLAAAADEKARIRGTAQTDNPLMKDMRSKMSMTPSVQSPTLAKDLGKGSGNQSLLDNPNSAKAAPPKPAATSAPKPVNTKSTAGPKFNPNASAPPEDLIKKTAAVAATSTPKPVGPMKKETQLFHTDLFDLVKGHLLDEGYVETEQNAIAMMANMSEEWRQSIINEISKELATKAFADRATREFESDSDNPKDFTKSGESKADKTKDRIVKKYGKKAGNEAEKAAERGIYGHNKYSEAQEREEEKKKSTKKEGIELEDILALNRRMERVYEAQRARENPEDHDKEEKRKYEPVRGEKTPMPPRGDKRREDFEKWYRANVR